MLLDMNKNIAIIRFTEDLDAAAVPELKAQIAKIAGDKTHSYLIDLSAVEFLDSHGVGLFVHLLKKANIHKGKIAISGAVGQPASVLRMVGFNESLVGYHSNLDTALKSLQA